MKATLKTLQILINNEVNNTSQINSASQVNTNSNFYKDVEGSQSFIRLEKRITNEESIKYAFALFKRKKTDSNINRKSMIEKYFEGLNFNNIKYPLERKGYEELERNNNVYLHVYEPNYDNNKIYVRYQSEIIKEKKLIVLFLDNCRYSHVTKLKFIQDRLAKK